MENATPAGKEKKERFGFRASREFKVLVEQAASLQGVTVSDVLTATAYREAVQTIRSMRLFG